jgi:L-aminopeptidase/D-esterase-like protein
MSVSCDCCVLSGRGLCVGLITRPEESPTECGVSECDCEASIMRRPWHTGGCCAMEGGGKLTHLAYTNEIGSMENRTGSQLTS